MPVDVITVLYINAAPFVGGAQVTLRNIVRRLDRSRFHPLIALPEGASEVMEYFADAGLEVLAVPMQRLRPLTPRSISGVVATVRSLREVVVTNDVRVVHANSQRAALIGLALQCATPVRFVWTINDVALLRRVRLLIPLADCVTCVSEAVRARLPDFVRPRLIYNGVEVDEEAIRTAASIRASVRGRWGIPEDAFVVGCVTRLDRWKGVHNSLEAAQRLIASDPNVWFVHVGPDLAPSSIYSTNLHAAGAPGRRVIFAGFDPAPQHWYPAFDAFIHMPTIGQLGHTEAFGMNVAEAMGYGLPCVVSDVGAMPELIVDGESGAVVRDNDISGAAAALSTLIADRKRAAAIGVAARQRQQRFFTQQREVDDFQRLYEELCESVRHAGTPRWRDRTPIDRSTEEVGWPSRRG